MSIPGYVKVDIVLLLLRIAYNIYRKSRILLQKYIFFFFCFVVVAVAVAVAVVVLVVV